MDNWFADFTAWYVGLIKKILLGFVELCHDVGLWIFDGILSAIAAVVGAIPAPGFLSDIQGVVGNSLGGLPGYALYVLGHAGIGQGMAIVGAGFAFRMVRKAVTLGQW